MTDVTDDAVATEEVVDETVEEQAEEPDTDEVFDAEKAREKIRKVNSENRNLRKRATDAEAKAQDVGEKDKRISAQEAEIMRLRVAVKHGLPESLVKRLTGTTEEEILQDAKELMDLFGSRKPPTDIPREKLRTTTGQDATAAGADVEAAVDAAFGH